MSVVSVRETFEGRDSQLVGKLDDVYMNRRWKIVTNDVTETAYTIAVQTVGGALPTWLAWHPSNFYFTCRALTFTPGKSKYLWFADAKYSAAPLTQEEQEQQIPNPLDRTTRIERSSVEFQKYTLEDSFGNALVNSAGDSYPPQVTEDSRTVLRLRKNVLTWNEDILTAVNTLNQDLWEVTDGNKLYTFLPRTGILKSVKISELQTENLQPYYVVSGEIHGKLPVGFSDPFDINLLDEGFHYVDPDSGERKRITITDENGNVREPGESQLLDGFGQVLDPGGIPKFRTYQMYRETDWSIFPW